MRLLFVSTAHSYRNNDFIAAADVLGIQYMLFCDGAGVSTQRHVYLEFLQDAELLRRVKDLHAEQSFRAVMALDDSGANIAARIATALHLPHNRLEAIAAARDKALMRTALSNAGVAVPQFRRYNASSQLPQLLAELIFPCVIKPLLLNGSRGVIRVDSPDEFIQARLIVLAMLEELEGKDGEHAFLVESFIPGIEVALEAILDNGTLYPLAIFDKPDPLDGPLFEETIYVTPSRLPASVQTDIIDTARAAAHAIGLVSGPVHAELRINESGVWVVEVAGRSIGGLCSRTLRFGVSDSLEVLILRQAMGTFRPIEPTDAHASGVMMIPIPNPGILQQVNGISAAAAVASIESIEITSPLHQPIRTLPAGESYLGFIFARAATPEAVEVALREAHACLEITITPYFLLT